MTEPAERNDQERRDGRDAAEHEARWVTLAELEYWLETPMQILGFVWLALLVLELTRGLSPLLATLSTLIWVLFVVDFVLRFVLAPDKLVYLRGNWLGAVSLFIPALRVLRVPVLATLVRAARLARGTRLITVVGSVNRAMGALRRSMSRRGLGYVVVLTLLVTVAGAAGMYAFERSAPNAPGLPDFPTALWWTAMIMTTLGSDYWPHTAEGRTLCLLLSIYAFAVWGYITAALATFFVGRDADNDDAELAGQKSIEALRADIAGLRAEVRALGPVRGEGTAR